MPDMNNNMTVQAYLDTAIAASRFDNSRLQECLDAIPVPVYLTDPDGTVTCFNQACAELAGREPRAGKDRWCISWRLRSTTDEPLPHNLCPMAVAIKEKREVRGEVAIAVRPDGGRRAFKPYPTPLFDEEGELVGALNILIDVSEEQAETLAEQADRCRRLSSAISDRYTTEILLAMAQGYERNAKALRSPVAA